MVAARFPPLRQWRIKGVADWGKAIAARFQKWEIVTAAARWKCTEHERRTREAMLRGARAKFLQLSADPK